MISITSPDVLWLNTLMWMAILAFPGVLLIVGMAYRSLRWAIAITIGLAIALFAISNAAALEDTWCRDTGCCFFFEQHWVDEELHIVYFVPSEDERIGSDGMCEFFGECMVDLTERGYIVHKIGDRWAPSAIWPIDEQVAAHLAGNDDVAAAFGDRFDWELAKGRERAMAYRDLYYDSRSNYDVDP